MKRLFIFLILSVLILSQSWQIKAHPHVFIDTDLTIGFDSTGLGYLKVTFVFDEMFSSDFIANFDTDKNGFFSKEEIKIIQKKAFSNLINYNYFIHIITHKKKIKFRNVSDFNVYKKEDAIVYTFTLKPDIAINSNNETIKIAPYDQSYYIDVALKKRSLKFENTEGYSYSYRIIVDEQMAYYFDQIFPDCIVLTVKKAHADHL